MKQKTLLLILFFCSAFCSIRAHDFEAKNNDNVTIYYVITSDVSPPYTVSVSCRGSIGGSYPQEYTGVVNLPASVVYNGKTYAVTGIGSGAFYFCPGVTSVTIPNSIVTIGEAAFSNCSGLSSITIPAGVTEIGSGAFGGCKGLTSVVWNAVNVSSHYSEGDWLFSPDSPVTTFTFGEQVKRLPNYLCRGFKGLTSITLPASLNEIGYAAFDQCTGLTSVTIPENVTKAGSYAFRGCSSLAQVRWNAIRLPSDPFTDCANISTFTFGDKVELIPDGLFNGLPKLTGITIPNSVTEIGAAFINCTGLTSVTIPASIIKVAAGLFTGCPNLAEVNWNAVNAGFSTYGSNGAFVRCDKLTSIVFGDGVKTIPDKLCINMPQLRNLYIGKGVTSISYEAFLGCTGLESVQWNAVRCERPYNTPFASLKKIMFGSGVEVIPEILCKNLASLTHINMQAASSLKEIGGDSFWGCTGLTTLKLPDAPLKIGSMAFQGCTGLSDVDLGNALVEIGGGAFNGCTGLTNITLSNSVTKLTGAVFKGCTGLRGISLSNRITQIGYNAFAGCTELAQIRIPDSVTLIEQLAFENCTGLTDVDFGTGVETIENAAFSNCPKLSEIILPNSLTFLGNIFQGCTGITSVTVGNSTKEIASETFRNLKKLTRLTLGNSMETIGANTFSGCSSLTSVTLPASITLLGFEAFKECTALKEISFIGSSADMGSDVFAGCWSLEQITCYSSAPPKAAHNTFDNYCYDAWLNVPCNALATYTDHYVFKNFEKIRCIAADDTTTESESIELETGSTTVTFTWPKTNNAYTYLLEIRKDEETVYAFTFNENGQLQNIAFAPGREANKPAAAVVSADAFLFTVTGLGNSTTYNYLFTVKDKDNGVLGSKSETFTTSSATDLENTVLSSSFVQHGSLLIWPQACRVSVYSMTGQLVFEGTTAEVVLPNEGIYIVKTGSEIKKVLF